MKLIVSNIRTSLDDDPSIPGKLAARKLRLSVGQLKSWRIIKESVDARRKSNIGLVFSILVEAEDDVRLPADRDISILEESSDISVAPGSKSLHSRPVVVGSGPAGLFAGLTLARNGYRPIVLERGECVEKRIEKVAAYWEKGILDGDTNVQFGEGGAGTFSDGKLTTRIHDRRCDTVLREFYEAGAPEEILFKAKPHIGSDNLRKVVANMRNTIIGYGGEVRFNSRVTSLKIRNGCVRGVALSSGEVIDAEVVVLAIGHSARDTFDVLYSQGIGFIPKPFSIGVRIEHPQEIINRAQFGEAAGHPRLGAADYQLFYKTGGRTVYSFCMCPGGVVVASASEPDMVVTNGMSDFARDRVNANSALVVSVEPADFGSSHPLSGIEFQRRWERLAFEAGGGDSAAPVQTLRDFINTSGSGKPGAVKPSYTGRTKLADLNSCLPDFVTGPMKESISYFDRKLKGFGMADALLTGVETRTSSPVRIPRGDSLEAAGICGLYPAGEGAGYAGGIVSAAVDGIRIAEQIIRTYGLPAE